jgi:hypothetical protein
MKTIYNLIDFDYVSLRNGPEPDSVYISPNELSGLVKSHKSRPLCKIFNPKNGKSILRYVRGRVMNGLDSKTITMDYLNIKELSAHKGDQLEIKSVTFYDHILFYPIFHPSETIRIAFWYFATSLIIAVASLIISIISLNI